MSAVVLNWSKIFAFPELFIDSVRLAELNVSGIYLWIDTVGLTANEIVYVGKSRSSLKKRLWQHYLYQSSGCYDVPDFDDFGDWKPGNPKPLACHVLANREAFLEVVDKAWAYANQRLKICFAPVLPGIVADDGRHLVDVIERQLLWEFQPRLTRMGTRRNPGDMVKITHANVNLSKVVKGDGRSVFSIEYMG